MWAMGDRHLPCVPRRQKLTYLHMWPHRFSQALPLTAEDGWTGPKTWMACLCAPYPTPPWAYTQTCPPGWHPNPQGSLNSPLNAGGCLLTLFLT